MDLPPIVAPPEELQDCSIGTIAQLLDDLGQGTNPLAILVICSDMLCQPDELSHANPGEVKMIQNAGAMVPPAPLFDESASTSFQKLLSSSIRHIIVCGHTVCGVVSSLLKTSDWSRHPIGRLIELVSDRMGLFYADRPKEELPAILTQEVVLRHMTNLGEYPEIQEGMQKGNLLIHGWIRDDKTMGIASFDPHHQQFS